ncbi:probable methyltransferase-like protein 25 [Penaeus indicus]|uniref:probable methyltransferase-like protein 25 n=1 Tax=Penaeus indicus TaxID=29960 RepID=UPI00300C195D
MASLEKINEALVKLVRVIEPLKPIMKCHMVDYLTANHWETLLPVGIQQGLLSLPREKLYLMPSGALRLEDVEADNKIDEELCLPSVNLSTLLSIIRKHSLHSLGVTTSMHQILDLHGSCKIPVLPMTGIMSEKKSHEVEIMSEVIARLAKGFDANWIMDLGSGKGYLSSSLVLQYGLNVLAMDSSPDNTTSALTRNTKLEKRLQKMKTAEKYQKEGKLIKRGKRKKSKKVLINQPVLSNDTDDQNGSHGSYIGLTAFITEDTDLLEILKESLAASKKEDTKDEKMLDTVDNHEGDMNVVQNDSKAYSTFSECEMGKSDVLNKPLDVKGDEETSLVNQSSDSPDEHRLGLVGLHTCGNLAASSIRLFISNSKVKFMCNVGCCYHLIEEEFYENPFSTKKMLEVDVKNGDNPDSKLEEDQAKDESPSKSKSRAEDAQVPDSQQEHSPAAVSFDPLHPSEIPNLSVGFPLSSFLRERKFALERNTRMLSCQPADRLTEQSYNGLNSLYWRALLQVVLKEKLGDKFNTTQVGRIASKCKDFTEYSRKAFEKLELNIEVTNEELYDYQRRYANNREKIERFFLLRSTLAPLIEGLILLDRLAFLSEQEDIEAAYLVQLFNPVTSPRCHAVIGVRSK